MQNKLKSPEAVITVFDTFDGYPVSFADHTTGCDIFVDLSTVLDTELKEPMIVGFRNSLTGGKQKEVQKLYHEAMEILYGEESHARAISNSMASWMYLDRDAIGRWLWDYPIMVRKLGKTRSVVALSRKYSGYYRIFGNRMGVITAKYIGLDSNWHTKWANRTNQSTKGVTQEGPIDAPGLVTERVDLR